MTLPASSPPAPWRRDLSDLLKLAFPVAGARLGIMAMGLTDVVIVGRYSAEQLGFMALSWGLTSVVLTAAVGVLAGVQVLTSRYAGQGRLDLSGGVFRRGAVYGAWLGLASAVVLTVFGPAFLEALRMAPGLAEGAEPSLRVFAWSLPIYLVATASILYLEALGKAGPGLIAMWIANAVNVAVDLVLVPGGFGIEPMGAVGAAWGTLVARLALLAILLGYIVRMPTARAMGVFDKPRDGRPAAVEQRRIGYGAGASQFVEAAAFSGMNVIAGWMGALAVAGWAIILNVSAIVFMVSLALATATGVLVGRANGARDPKALARGGYVGVLVATAYGILAAVVVGLLARPIASAYATDPVLIRLAAGGLLLAGLFFAWDAVQVVAAQALRARGDVLAPTVTHVFSYAVVMLPLSWALAIPLGLGLNGVVMGIIIASLVSAALLLGRFWVLARRDRL